MLIGIDCRLPTYQMGGISQYTIHLVRALGELPGVDRFKIFHMRREPRSFLPAENMNYTRSNVYTPCHHRFEKFSLSAELIRHRLDVFHSPDFIPPKFGASRKVITVHDLTFMFYPQFLTAESRRYYYGQIEWAVADADHIIADSEATRDDIITHLGVTKSKITPIHLAANPVYEAVYTQEEINRTIVKFGLPKGFILAVGTLEPRKNLVNLLRAYERLHRDYSVIVPLVLVGGKGWFYDQIFNTISELSLENHVIHLGRVGDETLAHLYHAAGVLAFPSYYEGFGLPPLEAMHCGCPIIASNRGSIPEVVGDAAISLDPDDRDAWVDSLYRVLIDADLARSLRESGYEQALKFTWAQTAEKTMAVYLGGE
ncbi:MAG: glycosyltransferase family 4 protein [Anaerolineae bacterium]|nr:glycosyltransferase family 4 protein [Anaerolineae bacterium]